MSALSQAALSQAALWLTLALFGVGCGMAGALVTYVGLSLPGRVRRRRRPPRPYRDCPARRSDSASHRQRTP
ncbi:MAG TPA: hypothetical protein VGN37_30300 [Actinocatenispora sp.]